MHHSIFCFTFTIGGLRERRHRRALPLLRALGRAHGDRSAHHRRRRRRVAPADEGAHAADAFALAPSNPIEREFTTIKIENTYYVSEFKRFGGRSALLALG